MDLLIAVADPDIQPEAQNEWGPLPELSPPWIRYWFTGAIYDVKIWCNYERIIYYVQLISKTKHS